MNVKKKLTVLLSVLLAWQSAGTAPAVLLARDETVQTGQTDGVQDQNSTQSAPLSRETETPVPADTETEKDSQSLGSKDRKPAAGQSSEETDGQAEAGETSSRQGWVQEKDAWYYYDQTGTLQTGELELEGNYYYLDPDNNGARAAGFVQIPAEHSLQGKEKTSYYDPQTGQRKTGWVLVDGVYYNFLSSTGRQITGEVLINGAEYYLDPDSNGAMAEGFTVIPAEHAREKKEKTCYYRPGSGARQGGWVLIDGKYYNFLSRTGAQIKGEALINGVIYFLDPARNGVMAEGFADVPAQYSSDGSDKRCYYRPGSGARQTGWLTLGNDTYNLWSYNGAVLYGEVNINGSYYYLTPGTGKMYSASWRMLPDGSWKYYGRNGYRLHGQQFIKNKWYYLDPADGIMQTGLIEIPASQNGGTAKTVYTSHDGDFLSGEQTVNGVKYYFDKSTCGMVKNEMKRISDGVVKYYGSDGKALTGRHIILGETMDFDASGVMTGTQARVFNMALKRIEQVGSTDLFRMFTWCSQAIRYQTLPIPMTPYSGYSLQQSYGLKALETLYGNCFCYATALYYMGIAAGYDLDVKYSSIQLYGSTYGPHGWVEKTENGQTYIIDPEGQYEYNTLYGVGTNPYIMWKIQPGTSRYNRYVR